MEPLVWFRFRIARERWLVAFDDIDDWGRCCWADRLILIDIKQSQRDQAKALVHELTHAAFGEPRTARQWRRHEREVSERYDPRLFEALTSMGIRWPNRPDGYAAFRRAALRRQPPVEPEEQ